MQVRLLPFPTSNFFIHLSFTKTFNVKTKQSIDFSILLYAIITILIVMASASCSDNRSGQRKPTVSKDTKKVRVQLAAFTGQYDPVYVRYVDTMYRVGDMFIEGRSKLIIVK